jgi:HPt (histidine-containing phosphotransfer) domain-containing protein
METKTDPQGSQSAEPLDSRVVANLKALALEAPGFLEELFELFAADAETYLQEINALIASRNKAGLLRMGHLLKGSSGNVGALKMARLAHELEDLARSEAWDAMEQLRPKLTESFSEVKTYIAQSLKPGS